MAGAFEPTAFSDAFYEEAATGKSGVRRLSQSWNVDRVQSLFANVQMMLGQAKATPRPNIKGEKKSALEEAELADAQKAKAERPPIEFIAAAKPFHEMEAILKYEDVEVVSQIAQKRVAELEEVSRRLDRILQAKRREEEIRAKRAEVRRASLASRKVIEEKEARIREEDEEVLLLH